MPRHLRHLVFATAMLASGCNSVFGISPGTPRPLCTSNPLEPLIDDLEDGDVYICTLDGRSGGWYTVADLTSSDLTPGFPFATTKIPGGRGTSQYAARFSGSGFTDWGAVMGFGLNQPGIGRLPYDASSAGGIKFWMKSNAPVQVQLLLPETTLPSDGGTCSDSAAGRNCNNAFSFQITAPSSDWTEYQVPFSALTQPGGSATWNPRFLLAVQFAVGPGAAFDVWVDDIRFYHCSTSDCHPTCTDPAFPVSCPATTHSAAGCRPPGTDCSSVATWCSDPSVIDDMEDADSEICGSGKRRGWWYGFGDGTPGGTLAPTDGGDFFPTAIPGGRGTSHYAARLTGSGFTGFGTILGLTLNAQPAGNMAYDASAASGIKFWMKNSQPVDLYIPTVETSPPAQGGACPDGAAGSNCGWWFDFKITAPSDHWVEYRVPFAALAQNDGSAPWNPAHLLNINFNPQRDTAFDLWVDDIQFYSCTGSDCLPTCADPAFPVQCPPNARYPAGCRRPGTDCATFVFGCDSSNTIHAPTDGLLATFAGTTGGSDVAGDILAFGAPAPTFTADGGLHVTLNAPATSTDPAPLVVYRFRDCVDASAFTGAQFSISGSLSGCTLRYFTEDSANLAYDGDPTSHTDHGTGSPGALPPFATLAAGQITSLPQTVKLPFSAHLSVTSALPINPAKITGLGWAFSADASTGAGTTSCVADLTVSDVRFY
ncbi:MAG: hypothetical protein ACJ8F1_04725 [Polyangia bacterium]